MSPPRNPVPQAVQECHALIIWLVPQLDKFPRNRRFTLGERLETKLLEVLEALVEAGYSRNKQPLLKRANLQLAIVRHLWRMAFELKVVSSKRFEHGAKLTDALGKQIGGWLKSQSMAL